jgi:hypothetical protein
VRGTGRFPLHVPAAPAPTVARNEDDPEGDRFVGRDCYVFNPQLRPSLNDTHCSHCRFYLTARCPHIDEFLDDVEELSPE